VRSVILDSVSDGLYKYRIRQNKSVDRNELER
jgi:hypothetical protein